MSKIREDAGDPPVLTCAIDGNVSTGYCPVCCERFASALSADLMTPDQRVAEIRQLREANRVPLEAWAERISDLCGRRVMTHEFCTPVFPMLIEEARTRVHPTQEQILNKMQIIRPGVPVIVIDAEDDDPDKHRVYRHDATATSN